MCLDTSACVCVCARAREGVCACVCVCVFPKVPYFDLILIFSKRALFWSGSFAQDPYFCRALLHKKDPYFCTALSHSCAKKPRKIRDLLKKPRQGALSGL